MRGDALTPSLSIDPGASKGGNRGEGTGKDWNAGTSVIVGEATEANKPDRDARNEDLLRAIFFKKRGDSQ